MAEINLLKVPTAQHNPWENAWGVVAKILAFLVVAVVAYYGYLFFQLKGINKKIESTELQIKEAKTSALNLPGRREFLVRQAQLKEFTALSGAHVYFSRLLPALASVTLKSAHYTSVSVNGQGKLTLSVIVPDLKELDKFLQVFNQPEVNKNFYNVRMGGFSKTFTDEGEGYVMQIEVDFNMAPLVGQETK